MEIKVTREVLTDDAPLPEGVYVVKVEKAEVIQSAQKGTPGVLFHLRVLAPEEHAGRMLFERMYLGEDPSKVLWRWNRLFKAATGQNLPERTFPLDEFLNLFVNPPVLGSKVLAEVGHEEYQGEKRARVKRFSPIKE